MVPSVYLEKQRHVVSPLWKNRNLENREGTRDTDTQPKEKHTSRLASGYHYRAIIQVSSQRQRNCSPQKQNQPVHKAFNHFLKAGPVRIKSNQSHVRLYIRNAVHATFSLCKDKYIKNRQSPPTASLASRRSLIFW